jgi:hypothetical protein
MQVSIYGHSLGTVLSYDILCHQTSQTALSTAPIADFTSDEKDERDEPSTSTPPVAEDDHDDVNSSENVLSGDSLDTGSGNVAIDEANDSSLADEPQSLAAAETDVDMYSHDGQEEQESPAETDETVENKGSEEETQVPITEVEALKAEVKMLQEKLAAMSQEKFTGENGNASLPPTSISQETSLEAAKGSDGEGSDGQEERQTDKEKSPADPKEIQFESRSSSKKSFTPYISYTKLQFEVRCQSCLRQLFVTP